MSKVIQSWTDPVYRASLSQAELSKLPHNPAGNALSELSDADLIEVSGGVGCGRICTITWDCSACLTWKICW